MASIFHTFVYGIVKVCNVVNVNVLGKNFYNPVHKGMRKDSHHEN